VPPTRRKSHFPPDRMGVTEFRQLMGWSKTTFWKRRGETPDFDRLLDAQVDGAGRHHFDRTKAVVYRDRDHKRRMLRNPGSRYERLVRPCVACVAPTPVRARHCRTCGAPQVDGRDGSTR